MKTLAGLSASPGRGGRGRGVAGFFLIAAFQRPTPKSHDTIWNSDNGEGTPKKRDKDPTLFKLSDCERTRCDASGGEKLADGDATLLIFISLSVYGFYEAR